MQPIDIERRFQNLTFSKTAEDIVKAATETAAKIKLTIEKRDKRIIDLRREHDISDADLVTLLKMARKEDRALMQYEYLSSKPSGPSEKRTIGAGVVNHLLTESDFIESERDQIKRLELIARNLHGRPRYALDGTKIPADEFTLSAADLELLGF